MRLAMLLLATLLIALPLAAGPATAPSTRPAHDRDPWIFRCVLDGNARMVVISLGEHRWIAYDTDTCAIAKVWVGDVNLTGPVYDTRHGPQPQARGIMLLDRKAAISRSRGQTIEGLSTNLGQPETKPAGASPPEFDEKFVYRGYTIHDDQTTLHFEHRDSRSPDDVVRIDETPGVTVDATGRTTLRRSFTTTFLKTDAMHFSLSAALPTSAAVDVIRLVAGEARLDNILGLPPTKAPAEIPFSADANAFADIRDSGTVVIDTVFKAFKPQDESK